MSATIGVMWCAPTTTVALLTHVVRGAERAGFTGLIVVLARTADASAQLHELSEEWTSVHDVTGHLIAVLSPDPRVRVPPVYAAVERDTIVHESAAMHDLRLVSFGDRDLEFSRDFTRSVNVDDSWHGMAEPPRPPREHRTAWTEAASRCASYFGVTEAQMPAVLLVSFAERTAVLIQLRPRSEVSLYDLCKQVAADLGYTKRAAELRARRHTLAQRVARVDAHEQQRSLFASRLGARLGPRMPDRLRAQYDGLDRHLRSVTEADPVLVEQWRTQLAELRLNGTAEQGYRQLFAIRRHVTASQDRHRWLRLATKVGKVIAATDRATFGARVYWDLDNADPVTAETTRRDAAVAGRRASIERDAAELAQVEAELADLAAQQHIEPGLAAATESAARRLLGRTETDTIDGSAALTGSAVRVIRPVGKVPVKGTSNSVSGTVLGPVVQAGHIAGDVHIHRPSLWAHLRRRFDQPTEPPE